MSSSEAGSEKAGAPEEGEGLPPLEGYFYQVDVSILAALVTLIIQKAADRLVLEPASQEDLEADMKDPSAMSAATDVGGADYRLVVQAKYRSEGIWKPSEFATLLKHGTKRPSALSRLQDDKTRYLLVTTAPADTQIQQAVVKNIGQWPRKVVGSKTVADILPNGAERRIAILHWPQDLLQSKLVDHLERDFRVPRPHVDDCLKQLREEALKRMRGAANGAWTRAEIQDVVRQHQGYFASVADVEQFTPPNNWKDITKQLKEKHAVIITGRSGTGKTIAATVLADRLKTARPGLLLKHIANGPWEITTDNPKGPVAYLIEDPWGKYLVGPDAEPWNDDIERLLASANADRYFIVTTRSDVYTASKARVSKNYFVELEPENYTPQLRASILDKRLQKLPRRLQDVAYPMRGEAVDQLTLPLELAKYVDFLVAGPLEGESDSDFVRRALHSAKNDTIEGLVAQQVRTQNAYPWAAVIWGVLKGAPSVLHSVFSDLQSRIADIDVSLDDGLEQFVIFLESGRNLRQTERAVSYYHPRVEAGLQTAILERGTRTRRILSILADALIAIFEESTNQWGGQTCARMLQAAKDLEGLGTVRPSARAAGVLDAFLIGALLTEDKNYFGTVRLAAVAMSPEHDLTKLCQWLLARQPASDGFNGFPPRWDGTPLDADLRTKLKANPNAAEILRRFVRLALPYEAEQYPNDFWAGLAELDPDIADAFVEAAADSIGAGFYWGADTVAAGAVQRLPAFWPVVQECLAYLKELAAQPDDGSSLAIANGEYSDDYAEHLAETASEDGYSAEEYIQAYVEAYRIHTGWESLSKHTQIDEMGNQWVKAARDADVVPGADEMLFLAQFSKDRDWEAEFWRLAEKNWFEVMAAPLLQRLSEEISEHATREAALGTAMRCLDNSSDKIIAATTNVTDEQRLVMLDDINRIDDKDLTEKVEGLKHSLLQRSSAAVQSAFAVMSVKDGAPKLAAPGSNLLKNMSRPGDPVWQAKRARQLAYADVDVAGMIDDLLTVEEDYLYRTIRGAVKAVQLAAELGLDAVVDSALSHRYADVRAAAMNIIASRKTGDLSDDILVLADDKGSGVKKALLKLIKERPGSYAIPALIKLTKDTWSAASRYYGEDTSFDIADEAAELLAIVGPLDQQTCSALMETAEATEDQSLAAKLFYAVALRGGIDGEKRVLEFGLEWGKVRPKVSALTAMMDLDHLSAPELLERAGAKDIKGRVAKTSALLAFLIGWQAPQVHATAVAKDISVDRVRGAMLFPLWLGAYRRDAKFADEIGALLPHDLMVAIRVADEKDSQLPRDLFNSIGDPAAVEGIISAFPSLFEKRKSA